MDIFEKQYEPYASEIPVWTEYGLTVPAKLYREWMQLGTTKHGVGVEVCALPARFWRLTLESAEEPGRRYVIETGSGRLEDYMPVALLLRQGMLVVTSTEPTHPEGGA